jgi:hypothetical protein
MVVRLSEVHGDQNQRPDGRQSNREYGICDRLSGRRIIGGGFVAPY